MEVRHIQVQRTARIFIEGDLDQADTVWIALHGYGQHVPGFTQAASTLCNSRNALVVPEGLSRFYMKGFSGEVGASWMTREDRLSEINDYCAYLDQVIRDLNIGTRRLKVLGFSQGASTACRWIGQSSFTFERLVLWAGVIPPDLDISGDLSALRSLDLLMVLGDADEFIDEERVGLIEQEFRRYHLPFRKISFEGRHRLHTETLRLLRDSEV